MLILLALSFLALFQMPHLSSAVPGGFFQFQRFSAAELRQSLGLESLKIFQMMRAAAIASWPSFLRDTYPAAGRQQQKQKLR